MKKRILGLCCISIICCMMGCKMSDYNNAVKEQEEGNYSDAAATFNNIKDYKDSSERYEFCIAGIDFEEAKKDVEEKNKVLETTVQEASQLVKNHEKVLDDTLYQSLETAISTAKSEKVEIPLMPENTSEIRETIVQMQNVDYTKTLKHLEASKRDVENSIKQYQLVNQPSEKYVIERLKKIKHVKGISAVTEDNDPNEHLNKAGGYTADVYFSSDLVNQGQVIGNTIIEKGTEAGGSIEVYATEEDANKRNEYLSTFDGTILSNGSHTVIGTVVIRISDNMTATQQKKMENVIIESLTSLEK